MEPKREVIYNKIVRLDKEITELFDATKNIVLGQAQAIFISRDFQPYGFKNIERNLERQELVLTHIDAYKDILKGLLPDDVYTIVYNSCDEIRRFFMYHSLPQNLPRYISSKEDYEAYIKYLDEFAEGVKLLPKLFSYEEIKDMESASMERERQKIEINKARNGLMGSKSVYRLKTLKAWLEENNIKPEKERTDVEKQCFNLAKSMIENPIDQVSFHMLHFSLIEWQDRNKNSK